MRKKIKGRKLSRKKDERKALLKSLAAALFLKEKIKTTEAKAKELSSFAEKILTRAKKGNLVATRFLTGYFSKKLVKKIVKELAPRYLKRNGGYTRTIKTGPRKSDGAKMVIL